MIIKWFLHCTAESEFNMDMSFYISFPPLRGKCHENILTPVFWSYWECLTLRCRQVSFVFWTWLYKPEFVSATRGAFPERLWLILPTKVVAEARASSSLAPETNSGFSELKQSCIKRGGWKIPVLYLPAPEVAKLSTVWALLGEAGRDLFSTLVWGDSEFAAELGPQPLLCLAAKRGGCFWEACYPPPPEQGFAPEAAERVVGTAEPQAKGCQALLLAGFMAR